MFGISRVVCVLGAALLAACSASSQPAAGGGSSVGTLSACQQSFSPERVAAGENCTPVAETYCSNDGSAGSLLDPQVRVCDGVQIDDVEITVGNMSSHYLAIRPSGRSSFDTIYLGLHYLIGNVVAFANIARLSELAKARGVLVLLPQAPSADGSNLTSVWPTTALNAALLPSYVGFLDGVVADGRSRYGASGAKLYVSGLSNGASMAYLYGCLAAQPVRAVQAVAGDLGESSIDECQLSRPLGTVIVHGTADAENPYGGITGIKPAIPDVHAKFKTNNNCSGEDSSVALPLTSDALQVTLYYTASCDQGRRDFLVKVDNGGHVWPGGRVNEADLPSLSLFGLHTANFDATLQGFDLLRLAGGG